MHSHKTAKLILITVISLFPSFVFAAIARDSQSQASQADGTPASQTFSHTIAASNETLLVTCKMDGPNVANYSNGSATYAGAAMTHVKSWTGDGVTGKMVTFVKTNPATGANNVVFTQGATPGMFLKCQAVSYSGGDQSTPLESVTDGVNGTGSRTLTASSTDTQGNSWGVYFVGSENTITAGTNSNLVLDHNDIWMNVYDTNAEQSAGKVEMSVGIVDHTNGIMVLIRSATPPVAVPKSKGDLILFGF